MTSLLVSTNQVRLNIPIPQNSSVAVTDVYFENQGYNVLDGRLAIYIYSDQDSMADLLKIPTLQGYWHVINLKLTPGNYPNLKAFQKECFFAANSLKTTAETKIIHHLFSRFKEESGCLRILPSSENDWFEKLLFRINFTDKKISEYLGLHKDHLLIDNQGMAEDMVWAPYARPYMGPPLKLIHFETSMNFSIFCEEVDTAFAHNKEICGIFLNNHIYMKTYIQPKNLTFHKLTNSDHNTLTFWWPETIKIIFFNLIIVTE